MSDTKAKVIPQWQLQAATEASTANGQPRTEPEPPLPKHKLLEQAAKFLDHEDVRDATLDQKIAFLERKGLNSDDLRDLLGRRLEEDSSGIGSNPLNVQKPEETGDTQEPANTPPISNLPPASVPPIITYPEFLLHSQRPPPLITTSRFLSTIYTSSAIAATLYGTSQYLLKPMFETLSIARHELYETASKNLHTLNESLEQIVSVIPVITPAKGGGYTDAESDGDVESNISDPTELFHRDTGTQTSPPASSNSSDISFDSLGYEGFSIATPPKSTVRLLRLRTNLSSVLDSATSVTDEDETLIQGVNDLKSYLNDITYGRNALALRGELNRSNIDDELNIVKAEIRGVKGVLLSAKSFPGVGVGRGR